MRQSEITKEASAKKDEGGKIKYWELGHSNIKNCGNKGEASERDQERREKKKD